LAEKLILTPKPIHSACQQCWYSSNEESEHDNDEQERPIWVAGDTKRTDQDGKKAKDWCSQTENQKSPHAALPAFA
jgi:hypothetical protein